MTISGSPGHECLYKDLTMQKTKGVNPDCLKKFLFETKNHFVVCEWKCLTSEFEITIMYLTQSEKLDHSQFFSEMN